MSRPRSTSQSKRPRGIIVTAIVFVISTVALSTAEPEVQAERRVARANLDSVPLTGAGVTTIESNLRAPGVIDLASVSLRRAAFEARYAALARSSPSAFELAREAVRTDKINEAEQILRAIIARHDADLDAEGALSPKARDEVTRAKLLLSRALANADRPDRALATLESIDAETPIEDYRHWLRGQNMEALGDPSAAYNAYDLVARMPESPMAHRARVRKAHMLFESGDFERAAKELAEINELYPDYPRRHIALFQYARALEELGRLDEAASAYQKTWFEFPYKQRGDQALARMRALGEAGHTVPEKTKQELYARYRRLRINKHWSTARKLFRELEAEVVAQSGKHSAMVHEIHQQLALNAFVPKDYDEALFYLEGLKKDWESGKRDGINFGLVYRHLAKIYAKYGEMKRALAELDRAYLSPIARKQARAEFLEDHGKYKKARELYDELYYPAKKKGWHYTWLLYKTGDFDTAHTNFMALSLRAGGQKRAKYLYWAARSKERAGKKREARELFEQVTREHTTNYYGLQAHNRLDDMSRRAKLDTSILVETDRVTRSTEDALGAFEDPAGSRKRLTPKQLLSELDFDMRSQPKTSELSPARDDLLTPIICAEDAATKSSVCDLARSGSLDAPTIAKTMDATNQLATATDDARATEYVARGEQRPAPVIDKRDASTRALVKLASRDNRRERVEFATNARIYWEGRDKSALSFARYDDGSAIGPHPNDLAAYGEDSYVGGLERALAGKAGELFPKLARAAWLRDIGMNKEARWEIRDVSMEYRELARRVAPRKAAYQLTPTHMTPLIDNRRTKKATWGYVETKYRWPVPTDPAAAKRFMERQQEIILEKESLRPVLIDAFKEVGDYYTVRKMTIERRIRSTKDRMQAYPRAFAELVVPEAKKWGMNPYLIWALMTVESSYNPDSVSVAQALGLLQVIPKTGLKTAELLGEEDFGHYDLLDEDVAIRHGVFYFSQLVRKFHGQELFAIAGYNGGPHRVAEWIDMRGDMPMDEFVEEIPFDQARGYTKKVSRFLSLFLRTYEGVEELYIGQNISREWRTMPNF